MQDAAWSPFALIIIAFWKTKDSEDRLSNAPKQLPKFIELFQVGGYIKFSMPTKYLLAWKLLCSEMSSSCFIKVIVVWA